jgi:hypothetical protein
MKKNTLITRILGLFMLCVVMLNSISTAKALPTSKQTNKETKKETTKNDTRISEWSSAVVVPSHAFGFETAALVFPEISFEFIAPDKTPTGYNQPLYRHSYFEKLFERQIAINAP